MQHVGTDLFSVDKEDHLVLVDRYSEFIVSKQLSRTNTTNVTKQLKNWLDLLGWPETIQSDGSPQFYSGFNQFCTKHNITHEQTSPHNPEANGLAETSSICLPNANRTTKTSKQPSPDSAPRHMLTDTHPPNSSWEKDSKQIYR